MTHRTTTILGREGQAEAGFFAIFCANGKAASSALNGRLGVLVLFAALAVLMAPWAIAAKIEDPPPNPLAMTTTWTGPDNQFVTCAIEDRDGWWWGTDNDGLWRYMPKAAPGAKWLHFRAQDGLYDDSITALCYDRLGRLWVGTERRGVSVYNGSWWRNFDVMTGPLGVHVNAIAMNPADGAIWIASEQGLAIYSEAKKSWSYLTQANGLVSGKITCIAFTHTGKIIAGTASDGLMIGNPSRDCTQWTHITATADAPVTQLGSGLPGNLVNCLLVNDAGKIFCGTSSGLAESTDDGATWSYQHGWEWTEAIRPLDRVGKKVKAEYVRLPLSDEFISCLAFDRAGHLYVGHRQRGCEIYDDAKMQQLYHTPFDAHGVFLKAIVPTCAGGVLLANYGNGLTKVQWEQVTANAEQSTAPILPAGKFPGHPTPAAPPSIAQIKAMSDRAASLRTDNAASTGYFLSEDWMTQGDWIGRYGKDFAVLCAEDGNTDLVLNSSPGYSVTPQLGHSTHDGEDVSHWLYWNSTGDPRVLFDPATGTRRQAEWNEHGERYAMMYEGPDLWLTVQVPPGEQRISLYFMNKDGHTNVTRYRDYILQLRQYVPGVPVARAYDTAGALRVLAQTRVANFWPGVYESFVVTGPGKYYVKIEKNRSLNAILQAVFVDRLDADAPRPHPKWMNGVRYYPAQYGEAAKPPQREVVAASQLWSRLDAIYDNDDSAAIQRPYRILALRAATASDASPAMLAKWRWNLGLWTDTDWAKFEDYMNRMRAALPPPKKK
ncbi:MAG: two-component regulator propeller domain-containing protein [Capsulimonadaceae bacterium]|nr:two-component regulator propeller domain-containing protein [Capsulimonadaceae bacterium]